MKRLLSALLTLLMVMAMCVPAMAEEEVVYNIALDGDIVALDPMYAYDFIRGHSGGCRPARRASPPP